MAFVPSRALRCITRALYELWPARGLNADFGVCQCFPASKKKERIKLVCFLVYREMCYGRGGVGGGKEKGEELPFLRMLGAVRAERVGVGMMMAVIWKVVL